LPLVAAVGFAVFAGAVIVAGLITSGYDPLSDGVGGLGAQDAADPELMNLGYVALAVAMLAAGVALLRLLPGGSGLAASIIVMLAGVAVTSLAFVRQDCSTAQARCVDAGLSSTLSTSHTVHRVLAVCIALGLVVSLWMMVASLRGSAGRQGIAAMTTWAAATATFLFVWYGSELYGAIDGAVERSLTALVYGWPVVLAFALRRRQFTASATAHGIVR
jgi:hypothetical protein